MGGLRRAAAQSRPLHTPPPSGARCGARHAAPPLTLDPSCGPGVPAQPGRPQAARSAHLVLSTACAAPRATRRTRARAARSCQSIGRIVVAATRQTRRQLRCRNRPAAVCRDASRSGHSSPTRLDGRSCMSLSPPRRAQSTPSSSPADLPITLGGSTCPPPAHCTPSNPRIAHTHAKSGPLGCSAYCSSTDPTGIRASLTRLHVPFLTERHPRPTVASPGLAPARRRKPFGAIEVTADKAKSASGILTDALRPSSTRSPPAVTSPPGAGRPRPTPGIRRTIGGSPSAKPSSPRAEAPAGVDWGVATTVTPLRQISPLGAPDLLCAPTSVRAVRAYERDGTLCIHSSSPRIASKV